MNVTVSCTALNPSSSLGAYSTHANDPVDMLSHARVRSLQCADILAAVAADRRLFCTSAVLHGCGCSRE